ncbi:unnamed protein product [Owenia fusiformis]|uniref:Hexosyltransferase n=1 Tax=Owenia fusiformis TaxID=6347 RepID=A0A8J1XZI9_OWEFU|nr:unnamed protein product [Owenia fusiformis]
MANHSKPMRWYWKSFTIFLCILLCMVIIEVLMIHHKKFQRYHSSVFQQKKNASDIKKNASDIKNNFCYNINAKWPLDFPKVVKKQKYLKQKIPFPFFEFKKWNNTYLDSISEIIHPIQEHYKSVDIISVISSSWPVFDVRLAMRQTLGTFQRVYGYSHKLIFLLGQTHNVSIQSQIDREAKKYGDILQLNLDDSYRGLTKKRFEGLKWAIKVCQKASLVLS